MVIAPGNRKEWLPRGKRIARRDRVRFLYASAVGAVGMKRTEKDLRELVKSRS
ncbi:hypothetical protein SB748_24720 [Rhizobium sp. SIMBA_035]|jgi:hypothetical protein